MATTGRMLKIKISTDPILSIIDPIFEQFAALLPEREVDHPLGCHRPRIPERVVFEKPVQILVFGGAC
jgi:hypothetical protein